MTAMAFFTFLLSSISVIFVSATNHTVGGATGWALASNMQNWTRTTVFYPGDTLEFIYTPLHDVLEVDQYGYTTCQTNKPIRAHNDGNTSITLDQPGTRYFICGTFGHCSKGLKVLVDVLPNSNDTSTGTPPPPPPPNSPLPSPAKLPPPTKSRSPPTPQARSPPAPSPPTQTIMPRDLSPVRASAVRPQTASLLFSLPFIIVICEVMN